MRTLGQAIVENAEAVPDRFYIFQNAAGEETKYTFRDIEDRTGRIARNLLKKGIKKGDRIGLIIVEPEAFVLTFLAAARAGIVPVPLYPPMALGELDNYMEKIGKIVDDAETQLLVVSAEIQNVVWQLVDRAPSLRGLVKMEDLLGDAPGIEIPETKAEEVCFLQYTSGSTSDPKGVVVTHASLHANTYAIVRGPLGIKEGQEITAVSWLPLYHDMGLIGFVIAPILMQLNSVFIPTLRFLKRPNTWMETVHRHRGYVTFCPPFALGLAARRARDRNLQEWDLSSLKVLGVGAEPIQPEGVRQFTEKFSTHCGLGTNVISPAYGMAEATLAMAIKPFGTEIKMKEVDLLHFQEEGVAISATEDGDVLEHVSCGIPLEGHDVVAMDPEGNVCPEGHEGELNFRGPSVARGYFGNDEATRNAFKSDGWLATGDFGYIQDGEVWVTGRVKDLIIINGKNLHPQAIEWPLYGIEGVRTGNVVAFSVPGATTEDLIIAVERKTDDADIEQAIRDSVKQEFGVPVKDVAVLQPGTLPKTSSGKLQRRRARQLYMQNRLGKTGSRQMGSNADKLTMAKHVARSVWTRVKHGARSFAG